MGGEGGGSDDGSAEEEEAAAEEEEERSALARSALIAYHAFLGCWVAVRVRPYHNLLTVKTM